MKKNRKPTQTQEAAKSMRRTARDAELARGGRPRAVTFPDRRAVEDKKACRGRHPAG